MLSRLNGTCNVFIVKPLQVPLGKDIKSTVAGIYALRQLQFKRSGRLDLKAVLALDCCSFGIGIGDDRCDSFNLKTGTPVIQNWFYNDYLYRCVNSGSRNVTQFSSTIFGINIEIATSDYRPPRNDSVTLFFVRSD